MRGPARKFAAVVAGSLLLGGVAGAQESAPPVKPDRPSFWQSAGGVVGINALTWFYNWHVQRWSWANVGTLSWWENLRVGFAWDDDAFGVNQLAHPYHGSLYFNAARSSGYGFWGSAPFVAAGSLTWELFTENVHPSTNDLINTTLGGIALGEVSYRMYALLTSGRSVTRGRQLGALLVSPISRAHSMLYDRRGGSHPAPESRVALVAVGQRREGNRPFVGLAFQYGSPFDESIRRPYDAFEFRLHLSPDEHAVLTHASVSGLLTRRQLARSRSGQLLGGLFQHYDYDDLPRIKASSQSLSGALLFRRDLGPRMHADLGLHLELLALGAVASDTGSVRRRDYDFGPGAGGRTSVAFRRDGREVVRVDGRAIWVKSLYASNADHRLVTIRLAATVPLGRAVSVGGDIARTFRRSWYPDRPAVTRHLQQFRAYVTWSPDYPPTSAN
ncbi:MAG TPA: DUF3943 domain-containing protein [Gemmatimonadales bacterium]